MTTFKQYLIENPNDAFAQAFVKVVRRVVQADKVKRRIINLAIQYEQLPITHSLPKSSGNEDDQTFSHRLIPLYDFELEDIEASYNRLSTNIRANITITIAGKNVEHLTLEDKQNYAQLLDTEMYEDNLVTKMRMSCEYVLYIHECGREVLLDPAFEEMVALSLFITPSECKILELDGFEVE